jgi:hypothetical protein
MIVDRDEMPNQEKLVIDLHGPRGNAHELIALARCFAKQLNWDKRAIQLVVELMMMGDYDNLINVFDHHFGDYVILYK